MTRPRLFADDVLIGPLQRHDAGVVGGEFADEIRRCHGGSFSGAAPLREERLGKKKRQRSFSQYRQRFSSRSHEIVQFAKEFFTTKDTKARSFGS